MARDKWFQKVNAMRLNLKGRGYLATLYALGDMLYTDEYAMKDVFGDDWRLLTRELEGLGYIKVERDGAKMLVQLVLPKAERRIRNRERQKKRRLSQCGDKTKAGQSANFTPQAGQSGTK